MRSAWHCRAKGREKRFLTHEQVAALAGPDGPIVRVLAYCGLRFGELAAPFRASSRSIAEEIATACRGKAPSDLVFTAPGGGVR